MRKFAIILAAMLTFASCGKPLDDRLVGTSYRTDGFYIIGLFNGQYYRVLEFDTASKGVAYWTDLKGVQNGSDGDFTYTLEYPELYVTVGDGDVEHYTFSDSRSFVYIKPDGTPNKSMTYYRLN